MFSELTVTVSVYLCQAELQIVNRCILEKVSQEIKTAHSFNNKWGWDVAQWSACLLCISHGLQPNKHKLIKVMHPGNPSTQKMEADRLDKFRPAWDIHGTVLKPIMSNWNGLWIASVSLENSQQKGKSARATLGWERHTERTTMEVPTWLGLGAHSSVRGDAESYVR